MAVGLHAAGEQVSEVAPQLDVVADGGRAPDLGGVGHRVVAGRDQQRGVVPLHAAAGRGGVAVLEAQVGEAGLPEREADVAGHGVGAAVARAVAAGVQLEAAAARIVLELEVQHAGNGVRAVLSRRAVAQHLDLPQRNGRDRGDVGALRPVRDAVADPGNDRAPVPALAVDEHQRVIRRQAAQVGGPDDPRRVAHRLRVDVEGGDQRPQLIPDVRAALADDILVGDGVDRHRRLDDRARLGAAADDDHALLELRRERDVQRHRGGGADRYPAAHLRTEARENERDIVGAGRQRGDRETAGPVRKSGSARIATGGSAGFHGDAGQDEARRVDDRARQGAVLCGGVVLCSGRVLRQGSWGGSRREPGRQQDKHDGRRGAGFRDHPCRCGPVHAAHCYGCPGLIGSRPAQPPQP